jgi:hypothetical protein
MLCVIAICNENHMRNIRTFRRKNEVWIIRVGGTYRSHCYEDYLDYYNTENKQTLSICFATLRLYQFRFPCIAFNSTQLANKNNVSLHGAINYPFAEVRQVSRGSIHQTNLTCTAKWPQQIHNLLHACKAGFDKLNFASLLVCMIFLKKNWGVP